MGRHQTRRGSHFFSHGCFVHHRNDLLPLILLIKH
ncbi:hypothetical protein PANA5342_3570 [Pantoea ananatis LMG 5342]|nr:hypothetical protein PANA5342_3570 [Pantoea ananatis LMG 5342]